MSDRDIAALEACSHWRAHKPGRQYCRAQRWDGHFASGGTWQFIQSGASNPVFSIGDLSTVWLIANVREDDAPLMRVGETVDVHVTALPGHVFRAKLSYVAPSVDPTTRRLQVRADVPNPDGVLKPQMFASFTIQTGLITQHRPYRKAASSLKAILRGYGYCAPTGSWLCGKSGLATPTAISSKCFKGPKPAKRS